MFGKMCDVIISKESGESLVLVNHKHHPDTFYCTGTINRYNTEETDTLQLNIYNLPTSIRGQIALESYSLVTVLWGYKDEGDDKMSELFMGNLQRMVFEKEDATSNVTKMWLYDSGNFKSLDFFTGSYINGINYYQIAQDILTKGNYSEDSIQLSEKLKQYAVIGNKSFYGSSNDAMAIIAKETGLVYKSSYSQSVCLLPSEITAQDTAVQFSYYDKNTQRVESKSGLVGIPSMSDDGLYLECLVNPKLTVNKLIQIDNSVISINQEGAVPNTEYGSSLDPDGLYVIVNMTCEFNNGSGENTMKIKAYSRSVYENSYGDDN